LLDAQKSLTLIKVLLRRWAEGMINTLGGRAGGYGRYLLKGQTIALE
jgi:hypothetical protein